VRALGVTHPATINGSRGCDADAAKHISIIVVAVSRRIGK